jgi:SAM-dependent methyltransferase
VSPGVFRIFSDIVARRFGATAPGAALEIGASQWTLLDQPLLAASRRVAFNIQFPKTSLALEACERVTGNSNRMDMFRDGEFDLVMSSSTLEHDARFWESVAETRRILAPSGLFVVGVPAYMKLPTDVKHTTLTYARHGMAYNADYYRFSEQAVREVLLEHLEVVDFILARRFPNPYVIAAGRKSK